MDLKRFYLDKPHHFKCCHRVKEDVYAVTIMREEVLFDVAYSLWKRAQMLNIKGEDQRKYEITKDDMDWFDRQLQTAISHVKDKLQWAVTNNKARMVSDELDKPEHQYSIVLGFSDCFWNGSPNNLVTYVHDYAVNYILADWCGMSVPDLVAFHEKKARWNLNHAHFEVNEVRMLHPDYMPLPKS